MKSKITSVAAGILLWATGASGQAPCANDQNGFVDYKNSGSTSFYQLSVGLQEKAAQTYYYSGPGKISSVRVYGSYPGSFMGGVPLRICVYSVDASGRPTLQLATINRTWWAFQDNSNGYVEVAFPNGVTVNEKFALSVEIRNNVYPFGTSFNLRYTGNGEGGAQDLASLAGTSTGNNWTSAKNSFGKDGDFYLIPIMAHLNIPSFTANPCNNINASVAFVNTSQLSKDSMFNKIAFPNYAGSNHFYEWNFGDGSPVSYATNPSHAYSAGGSYVVTLTTKIEGWNGLCTKTYTNSVSVGLSVAASSIGSVSCNAGSNGSFVATGQFGAPSYSFSINNINWQTSQNFTGLSVGTYMVYVKDSKGCTNTTSLNIAQPAPIVFGNILTTNATCGNATGGLNATATGAFAPFQFKVDNGSYQANGNFTGLAAGNHTLTVSDANSCTNSTQVIVNDIGGPTMGTPVLTHVSCYNGNDGSIVLTSTGGTGLIQYSINGGTTFQSSGTFTAVSGGNHVCVVKDNAGCTDIINVMIQQGQELGLTLSSVATSCYGSSNGQINAASSGGTGIHNYSLNGANFQSGTNFSGLAAGVYTVYVMDVTNCIKTNTVLVPQPTALSASLTSAAATCNGFSNGVITTSVTGGTYYYLYSINGSVYQGLGTFSNLNAGTYTVSVKDANNCITNSTISITEPAAITSTVNTTNSTCTFTNGSIMVIAGGGSGSGYQYSIDGGLNFYGSGLFNNLAAGTQYVIIKDGTGCQTVVAATIVDSNGPSITASSQQNVSCNGGNDGSISISNVVGGTGLLQYSINGVNWQSSSLFTGLQAGSYIVQVKDANGCTGSVSKTITQPNSFLITTSTSSINCHGNATGSAIIAASGGAGFLVYSINGGATFQSGTGFYNLPAGAYTVIVKDAANCTAHSVFNILEPTQLNIVSMGILNVTCHGSNNGAITMQAAGGYSPYAYSLNGSTYSSIGTFTGLGGNANYLAYVKDAHNCVVNSYFTITEPSALNIASMVNHISCAGGNNGAISTNVSGGTPPYSYWWSNGYSSPSIFNLTAGNYSLAVIDFNGCTTYHSYNLNQPTVPLIVNGIISPAASSTSGDGSINITVTGGVPPYSFSWSNGATTEDISGLNPGTYVVTITDANGCVTSSSYIVANATGLENIQISGSEILLFPNPAKSHAVIDAQKYNIDKIELVNLLGQTVFTNEPGSTRSEVALSEFEPGTYFVKITIKNKIITKRLVITN